MTTEANRLFDLAFRLGGQYQAGWLAFRRYMNESRRSIRSARYIRETGGSVARFDGEIEAAKHWRDLAKQNLRHARSALVEYRTAFGRPDFTGWG